MCLSNIINYIKVRGKTCQYMIITPNSDCSTGNMLLRPSDLKSRSDVPLCSHVSPLVSLIRVSGAVNNNIIKRRM